MAAAPQGDQESLTTVIGDEKQIIAAPDHSQEPSSNEITTAFKQQESGLPDDLEVIIITPTASTETAVAVKEFSKFRKWFILFIVALQGFLGPLSSSIYVPAVHEVRITLGASSTVINVTISLYVFIQGVAPMMWAALSEWHGRRFIYIGSTVIYVASTVGCAVSKNIGVFVVVRILQSIGASAAQAVGAGTISDLFTMQERGSAMGLFLLGPLIGPVVGPIAGGYINEYIGWRYIFWTLAGMGGFVLLLMLFFLPETQQRRSTSSTKHKEVSMLRSFSRPFAFLWKPVVILASAPYALAYGFMYFVISTLPHQLGYRYHLTSSQIGLSYLANGVGNAVGAVLSGKYADWMLSRGSTNASDNDTIVHHDKEAAYPADSKEQLDQNREQEQQPERRLQAMWLGILLLPLGELMYGWCIQNRIHLAGGLTGLFLLGVGVGVVQTPSNTYLVDAYQGYSASVVGASNLLRSFCAGCTPLLAPALLKAIGNGWAMTILSIVSLLSGVCIYLVHKFGARWRALDGSS